ncbi:MAG: hypothetical protein HQ517_05425 [SAR324 cluster bacterium]|nr:hypothetical protein [SAR324 cluster bacterium]
MIDYISTKRQHYRKKYRKNKSSFNPTRAEIKIATLAYLKRGKEIRRITYLDTNSQYYYSARDISEYLDAFLFEPNPRPGGSF